MQCARHGKRQQTARHGARIKQGKAKKTKQADEVALGWSDDSTMPDDKANEMLLDSWSTATAHGASGGQQHDGRWDG